MDSMSKLSTSSANLHKLEPPNAITESSSPASNQKAPVLSERKTNPEPLLGQNAEKVAFKHSFGDLVLSKLTTLKPNDGFSPQHHFRHAAAIILRMQESDQRSATITLFALLKNRVDIYTDKASVMGSVLASESRETARDMLETLKKLAEHEGLSFDEDSRASFQKGLIALETHINLEY